MSFPKYPAYKDSGVGWIGEVPIGWNIVPLKRIFSLKNGATPKSDQSDLWDGEITWITPADLNSEQPEIITHSKRTISAKGAESCAVSIVPKGSIIISTRAPIGSIGLSGIDLCTNQGCRSLVPDEGVSSKFFLYFLYSAVSELQVLGKGTTFLELSSDSLASFPSCFPSLPEQQAIASFLDRECGKIDALIAEQERLIALLAEKRQAVISHAVTKGLNPNAPMKDSGIPWIGMVPEGWEVKKVSHDFTAEKGKNGQLLTKEYCSEISGDFPVYSGQTENNGVMASINSYEFDFDNGVIFSTTVGAKAMSLKFLCGKFSLSQNCMIIFPKNNIIPEYSYYAFMPLFDYERSLIPDHMQPSFRISDLYNFSYVMPPFDEQIMILNFIKKKEMKLTSTEREVQRQITLLKERRAALISAAVTGKIDVRAESKALAA
ncbi:type I restriction enzyme, S subunit [Acetobacter senegalensis]|uniref:Type I restriction enzyme, S subunit n=1 Tax=Acetobacter senegalensis TaxID=446692 RepID=A0A0U5B9V2_9PROT|nr:restriction endonuclease subunit S [Acetobacter senegalensis]CEF41315.1 type I restriction enzyme, S subunit [Acetobacter senegalensis]